MKTYTHTLCGVSMPARELKPRIYCEACGRHFPQEDFVMDWMEVLIEDLNEEEEAILEDILEEDQYY